MTDISRWTKDGVALTRNTLPDIQISNIGGRVALVFDVSVYYFKKFSRY